VLDGDPAPPKGTQSSNFWPMSVGEESEDGAPAGLKHWRGVNHSVSPLPIGGSDDEYGI